MRSWMLHCLAGAVLAALVAAPARAAELIPVKVGTANSATDVGVFVAQAKGFFRDEGLDVSFIAFDSAAKMIAPFASGDLDVGGGGTSAGLYNAVARGIEIKIVADKNHTPPGQGIQPLLIRKDLIDSGRFKTLADLKGMKISTAAPGSAASTTLDRAETGELILVQISGDGLGINPGLMAQLASHPRPHTVEILERVDGSLLRGNVDAEQTRHGNFSGRTRD